MMNVKIIKGPAAQPKKTVKSADLVHHLWQVLPAAIKLPRHTRPGPALHSVSAHQQEISDFPVLDPLMQLLHVPAVVGRGFLPEEDRSPGQAPVIIFSEPFWRRQLGADPRIVGTAKPTKSESSNEGSNRFAARTSAR